MSVDVKKEDLRNIKTEKALDIAMASLLGRQRFSKITVRDICEEALISRATFYSHYIDKYDLLKYWLSRFVPENINGDSTYEQMEKTINGFVHKNGAVIKNIIYDANDETLDILFSFALSMLNLSHKKRGNGEANTKNIVLSNIYAGGMVYYLLWQVKNSFPANVTPMNIHLFEVIKNFCKLEME